MKLTFSSPVATAEFSKFAGILSAALSQHHLSGMGKTRDLFKKIRDIKGTFHAKIGTIKGRTGKKLTEELYKKYLNDPDNHNSVITHLEPDILECQVK